MIKNKLKINDSKAEFIIFRSPLFKQNLNDLSVSVRDMQVSPSSKVRDLGVIFYQYLTFHDHISGICKYNHFLLRGIGRIRNLLTFDATAQLIRALVTSRLDVYNSILYNLPNKQIERLQRIQNQASFDPCLLRVPPISKTCANSFFDRSFVYAAPTLWNVLDLDIRLLPFDTSQKSVKTHLYLKYFVN